MRIFRTHSVKLFRSLKAFVRFEVGLTRGPDLDNESPEPQRQNLSQELQRTRQQLKKRTEQLKQARLQLAERDRQVLQPEEQQYHTAEGITSRNIIWIFGTSRSGSTWLSGMIGSLEGCSEWREPLVGTLFALNPAKFGGDQQMHRERFILHPKHKDAWAPAVRSMVLQGASARYTKLNAHRYLVIKEPNGSAGAPVLMEALPESRMIVLVRDPRDVVASVLDSAREGGWREGRDETASADELARIRSSKYANSVSAALKAYEAHQGPKVLVKYEDLRTDTLSVLERICSELEIPVGTDKLARAVEKHSWENIPEEEKGEGKFYRKATPGGWQEDLTPEQAKVVEEITAPLLKRLYPS